jgi:MinD-like ATPase involved in chromosome partitioning or flagellar assembly
VYTLFWSPKGGSGTTVVAAAMALLSARSTPTVLIDLGGDASAALGASAPSGPGLSEWLASAHATDASLWRLSVEVSSNLELLHSGAGAAPLSDLQSERLATAASGPLQPDIVIDAGPQIGPPPLHRCATRSIIVVRPCYLALQRAVRHPRLATGAVIVDEPGRALRAVDVERALGVPVLAEIPWDPSVSRSIDAGLLSSRMPSSLGRALSRLVDVEVAR